MKAIQYRAYGPPEVLEYVDLPDPIPATSEVLIRVDAISVGPGDCKTRAGELDRYHPVSFPKIPGRSGVGHVIALGTQADAKLLGQLVYFSTTHEESGCCCELIARPAAQVVPIDARLDPLAAAVVAHPGICAWIALTETVRVTPGMAVLIHGGAGAVGSQAIRIARHLNADVTATASSRRLHELLALGAHQAIAYDTEDFTRLGRRFDVVFDTVGGLTHTRSLDVLKPDGMLVYLIAEPFDAPPPEWNAQRRRVNVVYGPKQMADVLDLAVRGVLRPRPGQVLPLARCADAHRLIEQSRQGHGRLLLRP